MKYEILCKPSYSMVRVTMDIGDEILAEPNAMVGMSPEITVDTQARGGILKGLTRMILGGENFFINKFTSNGDGSELNLAPVLPGDVEKIDIDGEFFLQSGAYLAAEPGLDIDIKWGGARTFFAKEGLFLLKLTGRGTLLFSSYGGIVKKRLEEGEKYIVDNGHIVGFSGTVVYNVRTIGGLKQTIFSGEGLVAEFSGPGDLYIQTRNERDYIGWLLPQIQTKFNNGN